MPLLEEGEVSFTGELLSADANFFGAPGKAPSVVVAALGPQALRVAGTRTDGTTLAWVGPKTIRSHIVPTIREAADRAGRPAPRIIASLPVVVTGKAAEIRQQIGRSLSMYAELPSYQAMFQREGAAGPADLAIAGSAAEVEDGIHRMKEAGVTDFAPTIYGTTGDEFRETRQLLLKMIKAA